MPVAVRVDWDCTQEADTDTDTEEDSGCGEARASLATELPSFIAKLPTSGSNCG